MPVIPPDGLRRLLKACDGKGFDARRDTALIMLLLDTGARRDELMSRTLIDLDQDLDVLLVLGKGRRERALPYGHKTALPLDRYLRVRERHKDAHLPWLWLGLRGQLTAWGLVRMLERRPPVACRGRRRGRPDAPGRVEIAGDGGPLRRQRRRRPRPGGAPSAVAR